MTGAAIPAAFVPPVALTESERWQLGYDRWQAEQHAIARAPRRPRP
jgi:hypothetical protein